KTPPDEASSYHICDGRRRGFVNSLLEEPQRITDEHGLSAPAGLAFVSALRHAETIGGTPAVHAVRCQLKNRANIMFQPSFSLSTDQHFASTFIAA
ncbi:MAG: hypothetical protein K2Q17_03270, partial [Nitrospiraceae bacterium]|nr:hypothetical protein [Nitrospiraceae bacterium]